jgi:hypothetical protein
MSDQTTPPSLPCVSKRTDYSADTSKFNLERVISTELIESGTMCHTCRSTVHVVLFFVLLRDNKKETYYFAARTFCFEACFCQEANKQGAKLRSNSLLSLF